MSKLTITPYDRKKYVLKTKQDERILLLCKKLEQRQLSKLQRHQVKFVKSQLLDDWRAPLEEEVRRIKKLVK